MGKSLGSTARLQCLGNQLATFCNSTDFQRVVDLLDAHTFGDTAKEVVPGLTDATVSVSGIYDDLATLIDAFMDSMFTDTDGFTVNVYPVGTGSGKAYYTGQAFMRSQSIPMNVSELTTFSFDLQFSGGAARTTVA